jgi:hypothetical protein
MEDEFLDPSSMTSNNTPIESSTPDEPTEKVALSESTVEATEEEDESTVKVTDDEDEDNDEDEDEGEEKPKPKAKTPPLEEEKKRKSEPRFVKIDGKMVSEADLTATYQKSHQIDEQMRQAAHSRKQAEDILAVAKADPLGFLRHPSLGANTSDIRERLIREAIDEEMLTDDQRTLRDRDRTIQSYELEKQERAEAEKQQAFQAEVQRHQQEIGNILHTAMEGTILGQDKASAPIILGEMAQVMRQAKAQGYNPTPEQIAQKVESKYYTIFRNLANDMDGETLSKFFGEDVVKKMRKHDLDRLKPKKAPAAAAPKTPTTPKVEVEEFYDPWVSRIVR